MGKFMDKELDEVVPVLLKKAGEVSNAGRENFLTAEADRTLAVMCRCAGETRATLALVAQAQHKAPTVSVCVQMRKGGNKGKDSCCFSCLTSLSPCSFPLSP